MALGGDPLARPVGGAQQATRPALRERSLAGETQNMRADALAAVFGAAGVLAADWSVLAGASPRLMAEPEGSVSLVWEDAWSAGSLISTVAYVHAEVDPGGTVSAHVRCYGTELDGPLEHRPVSVLFYIALGVIRRSQREATR